MHPSLNDVLKGLEVDKFIDAARIKSIARRLASRVTEELSQPQPERLPRLGYLYETQGLAAYERTVSDPDQADLRKETQVLFEQAYECWESLATLPEGETPTDSAAIVSEAGKRQFQVEISEDLLPPELSLAVHVAACGLIAGLSAETRLSLVRFQLEPAGEAADWRTKVLVSVGCAFAFLVRKSSGWGDIDAALRYVDQLRELQGQFEKQYIDSHTNQSDQTKAAVELVGLYHLAQLTTSTCQYLTDGNRAISQVDVQLAKHRDRAVSAFDAAARSSLSHFTNLLWAGCREVCHNAIWTHVAVLGEEARRFASMLAERGRPNPVIELWPSQQDALQRGLLDVYQRAILVEMPTSAGKTLLAKFAIIQAHALNPHASIAYIVPTRALVNQVTVDLRSDLGKLGLQIEQAVPAFELDPTEDALLSSVPQVLVTTPEKFDLLIKRNHVATQSLSLVIADEAHNVSDQTRGARLELLLGTIKRDRPGARFLLLSPFLPNSNELLAWLADGQARAPIKVDWKPGQKVVGVFVVQGRGKKRATFLETVPASSNVDVPADIKIPLGPPPTSRTLKALTKAAVECMSKQGGILVLCKGRGTAASRASELATGLAVIAQTPLLGAVMRYIETEAGKETDLVKCLAKGVAYHHSGLSQETRWLVERLIATNVVKVVCGTTTLAQGVNFPIRTVVVETLKKGDKDLTYQDFWNIAGRAGRALVDQVGVIGFPADSQNRRSECVEFLKGEAQAISSQIAALVDQADLLAAQFNLAEVRRYPQLAELMRFLAHAARTAGQSSIADDLEDVLRASLAYHQVRRQGRDAANRLTEICRNYLTKLQGYSPGVLTLCDNTGFATPSVLSLMATVRDSARFGDVGTWQPGNLFGSDIGGLRECIEVVSQLPEMKLGQGDNAQFNAERVAMILRDWVRGEPLADLADKYTRSETNPDRRISTFAQYLFGSLLGQASWGIGALQSVCLAGRDQPDAGDSAYVPSMIYFGVSRKEAIWLRMVGVPRIVADRLGAKWGTEVSTGPQSYIDIRRWITALDDSAWKQAIPSSSALTPTDMRLIWKELAG